MAPIRRKYEFFETLTFAIIMVNVAIWFAQIAVYPVLEDTLALDPATLDANHAYQFVTYMFLHATFAETSSGDITIYPAHIVMNMFVLAIFGFQLEQGLGRKKFAALYLLSGIGSALFYAYLMPLFMPGGTASLIGASGSVFGVIAAYAFKYPRSWVYIFGFFPMPAAVLLVFLIIEETFLGVMGLQPGVANFGHVGGIITGLLIMAVWKLARREKKFGDRGFEYVWE